MVIRKIDDLGRIVIPTDLRRQLKIKEGEFLQISIQGNKIVIEKDTDEELEEVEDVSTKEEYKGVVLETMEDIQDYLGKISELLEELQVLD